MANNDNLVKFTNKQGVPGDRAIKEAMTKTYNSTYKSLRSNITKACIYLEGEEKKAISKTLFFNKRKGIYKPLVKSGTFLNSITHNVKDLATRVLGLVGSYLKNPDYPDYLEYGTSKMSPKPTMRPTFFKNKKAIKNIIKGGIKKGFKEDF